MAEYLKGERMRTSERILQEVKKAVIGKDELLEKILMAILANGHILMEDMPGVGKTTIARAFADAMQLDCRRMQFTVDVLPADVTGFSVIDPQTGKTQIRKGAVFTNLFLADEINRTSSRTQAALLEVMEEGSVSVDGITMTLEQPFLVIATQNPFGSAGTQQLPESQLDRFMIRLEIRRSMMKLKSSSVSRIRKATVCSVSRSAHRFWKCRRPAGRCLYTIPFIITSFSCCRRQETISAFIGERVQEQG